MSMDVTSSSPTTIPPSAEAAVAELGEATVQSLLQTARAAGLDIDKLDSAALIAWAKDGVAPSALGPVDDAGDMAVAQEFQALGATVDPAGVSRTAVADEAAVTLLSEDVDLPAHGLRLGAALMSADGETQRDGIGALGILHGAKRRGQTRGGRERRSPGAARDRLARRGLRDVLGRIRQAGGVRGDAKTSYERFVSDQFPRDINAFVQWVLRESYMETTEDLRYYAEKVQFYNDLKKAIREEANRARQTRSQYTEGDSISPPLATTDFETQYHGQSAEESVHRTEEAPAQAAAEADAESESTASEPDMVWAYGEAFGAVGASVRQSTGWQTVDHGGVKDKDGAKDTVISDSQNQASQAVEELEKMYPDSPEEQAAFEEALRTEGVTVDMYLYEDDGASSNDDKHTKDKTYKMQEGESFDEFCDRLEEEMSDDAANLVNTVAANPANDKDGKGTDGKAEFGEFGVKVGAPNYQYDANAAAAHQEQVAASGGTSADPNVSHCDTTEELDAYIQELEDLLSSVGDDAQLSNVDLQNTLQKQQQTMQMMSNISKTLHDTAMAVIRKIGA